MWAISLASRNIHAKIRFTKQKFLFDSNAHLRLLCWTLATRQHLQGTANMTTEQIKGYGVCRDIEDAHKIAATARKEGLKGCYPSAAVVLSDEVTKAKFDYVGEAMSTLSDQFHGEMVSLAMFDNVLARAIEALQELDKIKKTLFYGKPLDPSIDTQANVFKNCHGLPDWFDSRSTGEMLIHGLIGGATEAGEQLEALYATLFNGEKFDYINIKEETGDQMWYNAVVAYAGGFTFDQAQRTNIAKLRARYPNKFTEYDAVNRNLSQERRILEK
jgi:NTP pyrophosphatase (non-canonical NTP hydrolase)